MLHVRGTVVFKLRCRHDADHWVRSIIDSTCALVVLRHQVGSTLDLNPLNCHKLRNGSRLPEYQNQSYPSADA